MKSIRPSPRSAGAAAGHHHPTCLRPSALSPPRTALDPPLLGRRRRPHGRTCRRPAGAGVPCVLSPYRSTSPFAPETTGGAVAGGSSGASASMRHGHRPRSPSFLSRSRTTRRDSNSPSTCHAQPVLGRAFRPSGRPSMAGLSGCPVTMTLGCVSLIETRHVVCSRAGGHRDRDRQLVAQPCSA